MRAAGVSFISTTKKWKAQLRVNGKNMVQPEFFDEEVVRAQCGGHLGSEGVPG